MHHDRRLIMLLGHPRSGTTWLATILASHPNCFYAHEPFAKTDQGMFGETLNQLKESGKITPEERGELIAEVCRFHHSVQRPPFFPRSYSSVPPWMYWFAWMSTRYSNPTKKMYRAAFSIDSERPFDVVIKEVGWAKHAEPTVRGLGAFPIVTLRHPCGVVASQLRGVSSGIFSVRDQSKWIKGFEDELGKYGFETDELEAMDAPEFFAVKWLIGNDMYLSLQQEFPRTHLVIYETLCTQTEETVSKMFAALDWELTQQTKDFVHNSTRSEDHPLRSWMRGKNPYYNVFKDPEVSMNSWRSELSPEIQEKILRIARRLEGFDTFWPNA